MQSLGYLLIAGGFLAAAYEAVRDPATVQPAPFLLALAVGALGVALVRVARHRASRHEDRLRTNMAAIGGSLTRLAANAERLDEDKAAIDVYRLRHRIEEIFAADLAAFVDARESIAHSYGLQAYADVMNPFAAGERYLNRVWSASTDGYVDEAWDYLAKAREQLREAQTTFERIAGRATAAAG